MEKILNYNINYTLLLWISISAFLIQMLILLFCRLITRGYRSGETNVPYREKELVLQASRVSLISSIRGIVSVIISIIGLVIALSISKSYTVTVPLEITNVDARYQYVIIISLSAFLALHVIEFGLGFKNGKPALSLYNTYVTSNILAIAYRGYILFLLYKVLVF